MRRLAFLTLLLPTALAAQGTDADYERALSVSERYEGLVVNVADQVKWLGSSNRFTFRRSVPGGYRIMVMDAESGVATEAFDHARMRQALGSLEIQDFSFLEGEEVASITLAAGRYRCTLADYACELVEPRPEPATGFRGSAGARRSARPQERPVASPDGRLEAVVENFNVVVRLTAGDSVIYRSQDGSEGNAYDARSLAWSPDGTRLAAYRVTPGYPRTIHYIESSPATQLQPLHHTLDYTKPGDVLAIRQPVLFVPDSARQIDIDRALFPNAYALTPLVWREDGRELTFEYNQRGHELYRVIGIDAKTGKARVVIDEDPETFFDYRDDRAGGKRFRFDLADGKEIIWMSERDGWNHLYLYDGDRGRVKRQITRGRWVVREVIHVDSAARQIWFAAGGMNPDQDPYYLHYYRVDFDGRNLTPFTSENGTHTISFSPDRRFYVTSWSRVDLPDVTELRRTDDRSLVAELGRGDASALLAAGWRYPEPFVARGRDGTTDIHGVIWRPSNFDAAKKYPVVESIYAGPHGNHVPKRFTVLSSRGEVQQAELGFIVVQIDGMGTSNRSKAFHDVAWKNLQDAGFPDRILWHRALAAKYPWYDIERVGIYGGSAGGQNAMAALLWHGDFYDVAVADNGCHDNRMDKIWWNELWMSWPVGPQYAAASNVENAWRLRGKLLLTLSELDTNVDPSSTLQVVNALVKAGKDFDFAFLPGAEHARGPFQELKRFDFFVEHLLGMKTPDRNSRVTVTAAPSPGAIAAQAERAI